MNSPTEKPPSDFAFTQSLSTSVWIWSAFGLSVLALVGSLALSLGLGLKACPLCFYQRTFVMSIVAVLGVGLLTRGGSGPLAYLTLPLAVAGLGVAAFHVSLEMTGKLECPVGILGLGTAPQQSLAMFVVISFLILADALRAPRRVSSMFVGIVLGGLLAVASCTSNPPMPAPPAQPYADPPEICRPPYQSP